MKNSIPILSLILGTFFWGTTFILVKETINLIPINYFLFIRFGLATCCLLPILLYNHQFITKSIILHGFILGSILFASYYFQTVGLYFTSPANAAFITGLNIIFIPIIGKQLFNLRIIKTEWIAVLISLMGTILLLFDFQNFSINFGDTIILLTAITVALHVLLTEKYIHHNLYLILFIQFFTMTFWGGLFNLFSEPPEITWYSNNIIIFTLFVTVLLATIFAFSAQLYAQKKNISPSIIGVIFALEPVFALIIDIIVGNIPNFLSLIGMFIIFFSILIAIYSIKIKEETINNTN
ncbi:MAG: DMT family transporter [Candidatus Heimdallarchaeota archaeon]